MSVFDVSQTEGRELPDIAVDELTGSVERYEDFFAALKAVSPFPITFAAIPGEAHGYCDYMSKCIVTVRPNFVFHARKPATCTASGFCIAIKMVFLRL